MRYIATQINERLKQAQNILIIPHSNPDGDALGSASALAEYLIGAGKKARVFCSKPIEANYDFIIAQETLEPNPAILSDNEIDLLVVVDSSDLRYTGLEGIASHGAEIINIDHHVTNEKFGHYNMVKPTASATAEIIHEFFQHIGAAISPTMATALLAGIITDTGNFTNAAATPAALSAAGDLLRRGADFGMIMARTQKNKSLGLLRLWGAALSRLEKTEGDLAYTYLTLADLRKFGLEEKDGGDGLSDFLNQLENARVALVLKETADGKIKGSFRTTDNNTDVAAMAKKMGGGGHKKAAGFTADGSVEDVLKKILTMEE